MVSSRRGGRLLLSLSHICAHTSAHRGSPFSSSPFSSSEGLQTLCENVIFSQTVAFLPCSPRAACWLSLGSAPNARSPPCKCRPLRKREGARAAVLGCWAPPGRGANCKSLFASTGVHLMPQSCSRYDKAKPAHEVVVRGSSCPAVLSRMPWRSSSPETRWKMAPAPRHPPRLPPAPALPPGVGPRHRAGSVLPPVYGRVRVSRRHGRTRGQAGGGLELRNPLLSCTKGTDSLLSRAVISRWMI